MPLLSVSAARTARIVLLISHSICQLSGRTPRIGPLFCESRFYLCVAMAPYPARGWSAGSVSSVEFDRQRGGAPQCGQPFPLGRTGGGGGALGVRRVITGRASANSRRARWAPRQ